MKLAVKCKDFLPEISKSKLQNLYNEEHNSKAKLRLLAIILRKEGKSLSKISASIKKPIMTISDWLRKIETDGLHRIYNVKQIGKPSRLTKKQLERLDKILENSPEKQGIPFKMWTTTIVQYVIKKVFDVIYQLRNVRKIVRRLGFSLKVPRQTHMKKNEKAVEDFKKNLKLKYNITLNLDSRSFVLMKPISK